LMGSSPKLIVDSVVVKERAHVITRPSLV